MTAATVRALGTSQSRAACKTWWAVVGATTSITSAIARGSSDTNEKKTQSTMYCAALGFVSEMSLRASGMNPPGFARAAPAPIIAMIGELAIFAHLGHHALDPLRIARAPENLHDPDDKKNRRPHVHDRHPGLGLGRGRGCRPVAEHECREDTDRQRGTQGANVEPQSRTPRPVPEDERQHRKRQCRRRHHGGKRHERKLGVDPTHGAKPSVGGLARREQPDHRHGD